MQNRLNVFLAELTGFFFLIDLYLVSLLVLYLQNKSCSWCSEFLPSNAVVRVLNATAALQCMQLLQVAVSALAA